MAREAREYVAEHDDDDELDPEELRACFRGLFGREPDEQDEQEVALLRGGRRRGGSVRPDLRFGLLGLGILVVVTVTGAAAAITAAQQVLLPLVAGALGLAGWR